MLFIMDIRTAFELAGVADAASSENDRPILNNVMVSVEDTTTKGARLQVVATDSYMLGLRQITFANNEVDRDSHSAELVRSEGVQLVAKEWKKALKEAATGRAATDEVLLDLTAGGATIQRNSPDRPAVSIDSQKPGDFPKWESLMGGQFERTESLLPAFNPELLAKVSVIASAQPKDRGVFPVRLFATTREAEKAYLKPWVFVSEHKADGTPSHLEVLVMPTKMPDHPRR